MSSANIFIRTHPAEFVSLGILAVITVTLAVAVARGADLLEQTLFHAGLFVGLATLAGLLAHRPLWRWSPQLRGVAVIATMFTLYSTLGQIAFAAIPWLADPMFDAADRLLFLGRSPSLMFASDPPPRTVEFLSFYYAAYIPYLYMSILLGLVGRPPAERDEFVTAFAVLYALGFLGYLFLPARGPIVELASQFRAALRGGYFHSLVVQAIDSMGGPHGAFPSLHVGASLLVVWFDLRHRNLLRGLIYLPMVLLIAAATIVLRYHWVVDLIAGALLALLANYLAPKLLSLWRWGVVEAAA